MGVEPRALHVLHKHSAITYISRALFFKIRDGFTMLPKLALYFDFSCLGLRSWGVRPDLPGQPGLPLGVLEQPTD